MANCIKKPGKTSDVPNFFLQGRQLQHAAVENPLNLAIFGSEEFRENQWKPPAWVCFLIEMFDEKVQRLIFAE